MGERVDLDAIERFAKEGDADTHPADPRRTVHQDDLLDLVAELRVAREAQAEVERAVAKFERDLGFTAPELWPMRVRLLREAIQDAYDQYVQPSDDPGSAP